MNVKDITIMASFTTILIVQNILLFNIPYFQLTFFLIFLYAKILGLKRTSIIVLMYVAVSNLILGFVLPLQLITMYIGFMIGPILLNTIFIKINNPPLIATLALFSSIVYILLLDFSWWLVYPSNFEGLLIMLGQGLIFALPVFVSSFVSVLMLFNPLQRVVSSLYNKTINNNYSN